MLKRILTNDYEQGLRTNSVIIQQGIAFCRAAVANNRFPLGLYQRDYDYFYLFCKEVYADSPYSEKNDQMFDLFGSSSFYKYAEQLTAHLKLDALEQYDTVLFGQPLSNFDNVMKRSDEEEILRDIIGDRKVLVLPHPNEILGADNKYQVLPNATVLIANVPSDLITALLKPRKTITFSSTIGITYALSNPKTTNHFFPIYGSQATMLFRYQQYIPNIIIDESHVIAEFRY